MRIKVHHETLFQFETPQKAVLQALRLTPRAFEAQHVAAWRIDVDMDCHLAASEDAFGNITHAFTAEGAVEHFKVQVEGEIETIDMAGVVRGAREPFPVELYLRPTDLTHAGESVGAFARKAIGATQEPLDRLHSLMHACHETIAFDPEGAELSAVQALAAARGDAASIAHLFIASARWSGAPARCVSGYLLREEPVGAQSLHVWAEAYIEDLGWVAFDPTYAICPIDRHLRVACALDHLAARPVRSSHSNAGVSKSDVRVVKAQAQRQWQS
jgi:transglutaminase-like putative cysteine protease